MAATIGMAGSSPSSSSSSFMQQHFLKMKRRNNNNNARFNRVNFVSNSATSVADPYDTLKLDRGASESDVKKAFRRLALQYHPDVCREDNCTIKFHQINQAYEMLLDNLRGETTTKQEAETYYDPDEQFRGMTDADSEWDLWEEWMGWEGAGIRDYSSHINPYI